MRGGRHRPARLLAVIPLVIGLTTGPAQAIKVQQAAGTMGVQSWLVESRQLPIIALDFAFLGAGSVADPPDRGGLARFGARMLLEGAGDLDATAFQERLAEIGAILVFAADRDALIGHLEVSREHWERAFDLLRIALTRPRFDADAVERVRRQRAVDLARLEADPAHVALRAWWLSVFPDHPYGRDPDGSPQHVAAVSAADLRTAFMPRLTRSALLVGAAGAIDAEELAAAVDQLVADLPPGMTERAVPEARFVAKPPQIYRLPFPQSACVFGQPGVPPRSADYLPALVLTHAIGGGTLTSRLFVEMREKRGLVYSVRTALEPLRGADLLIGHFSTENAKVRDVLEAEKREWQRAASGDLGDEEVEEAKDYLKGAFLVSLNGTAALAAKLLAIRRLGLDVDYIAEWGERIGAIEPESVRMTAQRFIRPESLTFAIAGDPDGL
jgi:zinc protease